MKNVVAEPQNSKVQEKKRKNTIENCNSGLLRELWAAFVSE